MGATCRPSPTAERAGRDRGRRVTAAGGGEVDPRIERSRAKVLAAATELLVDGGAAAVTVDAVVDRSGVAKSTLYRHWSSVTQLLVDVMRSSMPDLAAPAPGQRFEDALRAAVRSIAASVAAPEWIQVVPAMITLQRQIPELGELIAADRAATTAIFREILDVGVEQGVIPAGLDADRAGLLLAGPVVLAAMTGDTGDPGDVVDEAVDAFLALHRCDDLTRRVIGYDNLMASAPDLSPTLREVLASAARLQEAVPDAVLVGGSAAALHAGHRDSFDHDHVVADLADRYEAVLEAVEATEGWATSVRASKPPMTIMGRLGGIEAGLRQMRRSRPLETFEVEVAPGRRVVAPTAAEALRVKAYLVVQRNQVRDHLDVVALAEHVGIDEAVAVLGEIDEYYVDRSEEEGSVLTALVVALAEPRPRDVDVIDELPRYKRLARRWHEWSEVVAVCEDLALRLSGAA